MISKLGINNKKKKHTNRCAFLFGETRTDRFEKRNAARMSAAREGLTERNNYFLSHFEKENVNKSGRYLPNDQYLKWVLTTKIPNAKAFGILHFRSSPKYSNGIFIEESE